MTALIFYFLVNWAVKHSLLFFYAELTFEPWARRWIYAMHVIAFSFGLTCVVTSIFMCIPVAKWWDPTIEGYCINLFNFSYFNSVFMLACDLVLYIMPVIFTWNIKLRRHHRIAVNILFAMGGLVLGASAARIFFVDQLATHGDFPFRYAASRSALSSKTTSPSSSHARPPSKPSSSATTPPCNPSSNESSPTKEALGSAVAKRIGRGAPPTALRLILRLELPTAATMSSCRSSRRRMSRWKGLRWEVG
jgi:hypothetical protein